MIIIALSMYNGYETRKYGADKIVLLGTFIGGLLIAAAIIHTKNMPRKAGEKIVAAIKAEGIRHLLDDLNQQSFFIIKDTKTDHPVGFKMDVLIAADQNAELSTQAATLLYVRGKPPQEHASFFLSDDSFSKFIWKSESSDRRGRRGFDIELDEAGTMTVRQLSSRSNEKTFYTLWEQVSWEKVSLLYYIF